MAEIERFWVDLGATSVHLRVAGEGPPLLLLPQSPTSARTLEPQIAALSADALCIAPDLPGLGESDPLAAEPVEIAELAAAMLALMDRLGLERAAVYGSHTGGLVATEMALQAPGRVHGPIVEGYPVYTEEEAAQRLVTYFPHHGYSWDGAHLLWLWWRYREQFLHWPWNTKHPATRAACPIPDAAALHAGVAEIARRHLGYASVYAAAFRYPALAAARRLAAPAHLVTADSDSLSRKLGLLGGLETVRNWPVPAGGDQQAVERAVLAHLWQAEAPAAVSAAAIRAQASQRRRYIRHGGVELALDDGDAAAPGRPLLLVPPLPARGFLLDALAVALRRVRPVRCIALHDLPDADTAPALRAALTEALADLPMEPGGIDLLALGHGGLMAAPLAQAAGARLGRIQLVEPPLEALLTGQVAAPPDCEAPTQDGTHLLRFWDRMRLEGLFHPLWHPEAGGPTGRPESLEGLGDWVMAALPALAAPQIGRFLAEARARPESWRIGRAWEVRTRWPDPTLAAASERLRVMGEPVTGPLELAPWPAPGAPVEDPAALMPRTMKL
jgi:pimeloyl-ACP methyl ester carboxylesterase